MQNRSAGTPATRPARGEYRRQDRATTADPAGTRVVLIDDAADFRRLMRLALERGGGYVVVGEASNGLEGLAVVRMHEPQLVLLDISMPIMGGLPVLPKMRQMCPDAKVVMLSAFAASRLRDQDVSLEDRALALGADGYIQKGQGLGPLMSNLRAVMDGATDRDAWMSPTRARPLNRHSR
jgi:DNA-binding NarL/FixJ family response regulator